MSERARSVEAALADRLINYSDALVAVSFLGVSGIGLAVADADTRCTVAQAAGYVMLGNLANGVIFTAVILLFHRWETKLRAADPPSEMVSGYTHWLHIARLVILWVSIVMAIVLMAQTRDDECGTAFEPTQNVTASLADTGWQPAKPSKPLKGSCG